MGLPLTHLRGLAAWALVLTTTTCSPAPAPDAGSVDAGVDAGVAGRDAGRRDAGRSGDAGLDAGSDGGGPRDGGPDDPGWVRVPGLPPECPIERATHPERLWDLRWEPCEDGTGAVVAGCQQAGWSVRTGSITAAHREGDQTWITTLQGGLESGRMLGIAPIEGPLLAAWREPAQTPDDELMCRITAVAVGGGRATVTFHFTDWSDDRRSQAHLYLAPLEEIRTADVPLHIFPAAFVAGGRTVLNAWLSEEMLVIQTSPDPTLYTYHDGVWSTLTGRDMVEGTAQGPHLVGDHVLWETWRGVDDVRLVHARPGEATAVWRDISPNDLKGFGTDGVDVAWYQNYDRREDLTYARTELWAATYRRDIEEMTARLVREVEVRSNDPAVGGGWIAQRRLDPQRVEIFSLRDGTRRTFFPPDGYVITEPFYASEHEIMYRGRRTTRFDPTLLPPDIER